MAKIKVTTGGCGIKFTDNNGLVRYALKTPDSGAFECDDAQAARLVALKVARYVVDKDMKLVNPEKLTGTLDPKDLETWDYNDLKKLAADMGVVPLGQKKADYIAAITAVEVEVEDEDLDEDLDEEDPDDLPELNAVDPE